MIPDDSNICLIGKKNTGKSCLIRDILYNKQNIPLGTVISSTEYANRFFSNFIPKPFIHYRYFPYIVDNAVRRQGMIVKKMNKEKDHYGYSKIDPRAFCILDDCMYDDAWTRQTSIREIFMNGRHYRLLFMVSMQYPLGIPPSLRTNIDFTFILRENLTSNRRKIWENYAGMFPTFDMFCQVMDQCTENFECLVIQNNSRSNKLEDQVFWYKATMHDNFRMGSPEFWAMSSSNDDDDDDIDNDLETLQNTMRQRQQDSLGKPQRKGPYITVRKRV